MVKPIPRGCPRRNGRIGSRKNGRRIQKVFMYKLE